MATRGCYVPTFFEMQVNTNDDEMIINKMSDKEATVLFHEYIHFLQDFTTYYGLNKLYVHSDYIHGVVNTIYKGKEQFTVPFSINDNTDTVQLNLLICNLTDGDNKDVSTVIINDIQKDYEPFDPNPHLEGIETINLRYNGNNYYTFGASAIMESMAYIMERLCSPRGVLPSSDFPYCAAELVAQYYDEDFGSERNLLKVLALCDVSLQISNPGVFFVDTMKLIKDKKLVISKAEDVYDWFYTTSMTFVQNFNVLLTQARESLHSYICNVPGQETYHQWIDRLMDFAQDWRICDKSFLLKMARQDNLKKNDCWGYTVARVGSPLMKNSFNHYFKLPYKDMPEGDTVEIFSAIKEIFDLFSCGNRECKMYEWCCHSPEATPNELCKTAPWKKCTEERLCPYAFLWKHWGLMDYEPIINQ